MNGTPPAASSPRPSALSPCRRRSGRRLTGIGLAVSLTLGTPAALLPATADAAPLDRTPTRAARLVGVTASGGGYAGWALDQSRAVRSRTVNATPAGVPGIDVSSYQGNVNWASWYSKGKRWAYAKATEGTSYTNPYFSQQYTGSYNAGMTHGAYHFARPDSGTGAAQAKYFVAHGGGWSADGKTLPGALDIEDNYAGGRCYGNTDAENVAWVKSFVSTYKSLTGRDAVIYTNISFWKDCLGNTTAFSKTSPFWLAYWSSSRPSSYPGGWTFDTLWQYSGTGSTDLDVFNGSSARLKVLALGSEPSNKDTDGDGLSDKTEIAGIYLSGYGRVKPSPFKKDTDGDGLSDYVEVRTGFRVYSGTPYTTYASPTKKDTDGDGLSDASERTRRTSPRKKDTDGDRLADKTEITGISLPGFGLTKPNPLKKDSDGDGLSDYRETKQGFRVYFGTPYTTYASPNRRDTDGDGWTDKTEYSRRTSPLKQNTDGDRVRDPRDHYPLNAAKR